MTKNSILLRRIAEDEGIRKVESERPWEGKPNFVPEYWKNKGCTQTFQMKWKKSVDLIMSHWQVEGSGGKSESLNDTNHSYPLKDITKRRLRLLPLPLEGIPPSECWNLEWNHSPPGTKLERRLRRWEEKPLLVCLKRLKQKA